MGYYSTAYLHQRNTLWQLVLPTARLAALLVCLQNKHVGIEPGATARKRYRPAFQAERDHQLLDLIRKLVVSSRGFSSKLACTQKFLDGILIR